MEFKYVSFNDRPYIKTVANFPDTTILQYFPLQVVLCAHRVRNWQTQRGAKAFKHESWILSDPKGDNKTGFSRMLDRYSGDTLIVSSDTMPKHRFPMAYDAVI